MLTQLANLTFVLFKNNPLCGLSAYFCFVSSFVSRPSFQCSRTALACTVAAVCLGNIPTPPSFILNVLAELFLILFSRHLYSISLLMSSCHPLLFHFCPPFRVCACTHTHISFPGVVNLLCTLLPSTPLAPAFFTRILIFIAFYL